MHPSLVAVAVLAFLLPALATAYEYDLFEGDIQIPRNTTHHFSPLGSLSSLEQVARLSALWPLGRIPYTIDVASGLPANSHRITDAIAHWQRKTCIRFTPRTNEEHYINFKFNGPDDCSSPVGMQIGMGIL